jgi:hypothetical protein
MEEPWFTYWVRPGGKRNINPRNAKGWAALAIFVVLVTIPSFFLDPWLNRNKWLLVPYIAGIGLVTFGFIRFAIAKSERVELDLTPDELAEFRAWKRRGKR